MTAFVSLCFSGSGRTRTPARLFARGQVKQFVPRIGRDYFGKLDRNHQQRHHGAGRRAEWRFVAGVLFVLVIRDRDCPERLANVAKRHFEWERGRDGLVPVCE